MAVIVDLTKNYYSNQLLTQLYDTFDCYKHGVAMMTQFHDNKYNLSFKGMDDIQTKVTATPPSSISLLFVERICN